MQRGPLDTEGQNIDTEVDLQLEGPDLSFDPESDYDLGSDEELEE